MKIHLIWAVSDGLTESPWVVAAWDEYCIDSNEDGWLEEIKKARSEYGAENIRETTILADYDKAIQAFKTSDITPDAAA